MKSPCYSCNIRWVITSCFGTCRKIAISYIIAYFPWKSTKRAENQAAALCFENQKSHWPTSKVNQWFFVSRLRPSSKNFVATCTVLICSATIAGAVVQQATLCCWPSGLWLRHRLCIPLWQGCFRCRVPYKPPTCDVRLSLHSRHQPWFYPKNVPKGHFCVKKAPNHCSTAIRGLLWFIERP